MKKLMILGGSKYIIPVIKKAQKLGIFVLTCDFLPNNYAHKFSNKYINISIIDKENVLKVARNEKIDGIISFACDPGVSTACYVAEMMGLPNVGPYESIKILQNKGLFRNFLKNHSFNTPFFKTYSCLKQVFDDANILPFPVIIKPTDSAGSKGVSKASNYNELIKSAHDAFDNSIKKEIIIEQFIDYKGHPSDADSFIVDGEFLYFGLSSQLFDCIAINPYTPAAYFWPPSISNENSILLKTELERLFKLLKLKTCILNIEVRVDSRNMPYIMEVSPRGGGNRLTEMIEYATGIDFISEYLKYSVGLKSEANEKIKQINFNNWCEIILHSRESGYFKGIEIDNDISKFLVEKDIWVKNGEYVEKFTGANRTIGTLIFAFKDQTLMQKVLNDIDKFIRVIVE